MFNAKQNQILYTRQWRPETDAILLNSALDHFIGFTPLADARLPREALRKVVTNIENVFERVYLWENIEEQFQFLRDRLIAFKTVIETRDVSFS